MNSMDVVDIGSDVDSNVRFNCDLCDEFFSTREKLGKHLQRHACSDKSCSSCNPSSGKQHLKASAREIHFMNQDDKKKNESKLTNVFRETSFVAESHGDDKNSSENYLYGQKGETHRRLPVLRGTHVFFCIECEETFKSKWDLYEHDTFVCHGYCEDIIFAREEYFPRDIEDKLPPEKRLFQCEKCEASFSKKFNLERHVKCKHSHRIPEIPLDHVSVKECFKCPLCKLVYSSRQGFERHLNQHFHADFFICTVCKKTFYQKRYCKQHMSSHSNLRKYSCKLCDKTYKTKYGLLKHEKCHHS